MCLADEIGRMESLEDLFTAFGVPFDPTVLAAQRFRILQRFGEEVGTVDFATPNGDPTDPRVPYAAALKRAYDLCLADSSQAGTIRAGRPRLFQMGVPAWKR